MHLYQLTALMILDIAGAFSFLIDFDFEVKDIILNDLPQRNLFFLNIVSDFHCELSHFFIGLIRVKLVF